MTEDGYLAAYLAPESDLAVSLEGDRLLGVEWRNLEIGEETEL